jgi:leucyl aminopeptidase
MTASTTAAAGTAARFDPIPSWRPADAVTVTVEASIPDDATIVGIPTFSDGAVPERVPLDRATLEASGFTAGRGETLVLPRADGPTVVETGVGSRASVDAAAARDAAAAFARAAVRHERVVVDLTSLETLDPAVAGQAVTEGVLLARYRYRVFRTIKSETQLRALTIVARPEHHDAVREGVRRGQVTTRGTNLARDLGNTPATHLTAARMGDVAIEVGTASGLTVEVHGQREIIDMGLGGLLGVNAGSKEEARYIKLTYTPSGTPTGHLALVGKGIMYDAGGISLKPSDAMHALMKLDMSGAGDILGAMTTLRDLGGTATVTGHLMCTDNMPSGTATRLGDVLTIRGGTTVEVVNADAEGRLVMADGIVLATEDGADAIVTVATLTGAAMRTFGSALAPVMGSHPELVARLKAAGSAVDEPLWELPLVRAYRKQIDSKIAHIKNMGGENAGTITAALFLDEFTGGTPFGHLDICGPMISDTDDGWRPTGATAFSTRLLSAFAVDFRPPTTG